MNAKSTSTNKIVKAFALGSMLTLSASLTGCGVTNLTQKTADKPTDHLKKDSKDPTKYANGEKKPNVVYIVLDDIGFSDIGAYGSEIKTPNIDALAENGLRYNNFNATPLCSPTRASLLTGRENHSVGMGHVANVSLEAPNYQGSVTDAAGTVAEMVKEKGYGTYGIGKWHLAPIHTVTPVGPFDYWPLSKGFTRYYGFMDGETSQFKPQLVNGNELIDPPNTEEYNLNDDLLQHAKQYITDHVSIFPDKPFYLNYAFGAGHSPIQVPDKYIEMYKGVYDKGWDVVRQERFERQKELGIIPDNAKLATDPTIEEWTNLSDKQKKVYARFMEAYAGFITQADEQVGKLVDHLKATGQLDNTMIVLIGDNGAPLDGGTNGTDSFYGTLTGQRVPTVDDLMKKYDLIGGPDMQALYPKGWANVSNTPFNTYKISAYAGALRNPLIISWPLGIKDKGSIRTQYVHVTDITPTVLDILNFEVPKEIDGVKQMPMYGTSIVSTFDHAEAPEVRKTAITNHQPTRAIYHEGWKAIGIHKYGTSFDEDVWELYKLNEDYTETNNVADEYPEMLKKLQNLFMSEAKKHNMLPFVEITPADMAYIREDSPANRSTFKYYPGVGMINPSAMPPVNTNSFTITVPITKGGTGVLAAMGDEIGGYTFYMKDNKLIFLYNKFDTISKITSDIDIPADVKEVKLEFERTSLGGGIGILYIDGVEAGKGELQTSVMLSTEGLSIGRDALNPVAMEYKDQGEFAFTGKFDYVQYDINKFIPKQ